MSRPIPANLMREPPLVAPTDDDADSTELIRRALPSWLTSLVSHLALLVMLATVSVFSEGSWRGSLTSVGVAGGGSDGDDGDGLLHEMGTSAELSTIAEQVASPQIPPIESVAVDSLPEINVPNLLSAAHLSSSLPGKSGAPGRPGKGDGSGSGQAYGNGETGVFGLVSRGSKFVYVFDRSGSMNSRLTYTSEGVTNFGTTALDAAKAELLKSLDALDTMQKFHIVFYNQDPMQFDTGNTTPRLVVASRENRLRAADFVASVSGDGNTNHMEALEIALRLRPDVIFLLTDGEPKDDLTSGQLEHLTGFNKGQTKINVIQFCHAVRADGTLAELAKRNAGQHTFINLAGRGK